MKKKYFRQSLFLILAIISTIAVGAESVDGIWQSESQEKSYYSIHQHGNTIVLIDLSRLEFGGETLSAAYIGSVDDLVLNQMAKFPLKPEFDFPLKITFISDKEATLMPLVEGDVVDVFFIKLKKVFK